MLASLIPPILLTFVRRITGRVIYFTGPYESWPAALAVSGKYDAEKIARHVRDSVVANRKNRDATIRDSVSVDGDSVPFPLISGILCAAAANGLQVSVLDFGGSLGVRYLASRKFLSCLNAVRWSVVELQPFVEYGRQLLEDEELRFYSSIEECLENEQPNVIVLSGVLQYVENPHALLEKMLECRPGYLIVDRTPTVVGARDLILVQNIPKSIYGGSHPCRAFSEQKLMHTLKNGDYEQLCAFDAIDGRNTNAPAELVYRGYIYKRNDATGGHASQEMTTPLSRVS